jgi:hypothetical protein
LLHQSIVAALFLDPEAELGILGVVHWHVTVPRFFAKALEVFHVSNPCYFLSIPREAEFVQEIDALLGDRTLLVV